ncbi:hypothetical protein SK128_021944 [Halocaridina rubra]|uniref:Uncharacterized protein n=1 Tax=Halocaridina rubra TaxID=373956 RepID=A0AAN9A6V7_HALRR
MENKAYESGEHSTSHGNGAIEAIENGTLTSKENGIQHCKENGISHHEGNGMPQLKEIGMPLHRENEMLQAKEKGTKQDRENGMSHHQDDNHKKFMIPKEQNTTVQDNAESDDNSIHLCGAFNRYPKWLQRFANPRCFLLAFCIQNIIGGAEFAFTLGSTTSIEKHFQFSSGDIGMLILLSEIGPIITSVLLSFMGGRGNRPKWMCIGLIIGSIGVFLNFSTFLLYPAPTLSESGLLGESSKKFCSLQDVIDYQHSNTTSTTTTSSSLTLQLLDVKGSHETCQHSKNFSYFIWLIGYTCKALSGTLIYTIGAPYLDDGISSNSSPIYFAISLSVRVVGPAIGFALSAIALNAYVYPGKNYGKEAYAFSLFIACILPITLQDFNTFI